MSASYEVTGPLHVVCKCDFCERKREMTPEQKKRVAEIAAKACLEFGVNYDGVSFAAEEAILAALADPTLNVVDEQHYLKAVTEADHFFSLSGDYLKRANNAEEQRDKLAVALKYYGQHVDGCVDNDSVDCICGYNEALKECGK